MSKKQMAEATGPTLHVKSAPVVSLSKMVSKLCWMGLKPYRLLLPYSEEWRHGVRRGQ